MKAYWAKVKAGELPAPRREPSRHAPSAESKARMAAAKREYWRRVKAGELPAPQHKRRSDEHKEALRASKKAYWDQVKAGERPPPAIPERYASAEAKAEARKASHKSYLERREIARAKVREAKLRLQAERKAEGLPIEKRKAFIERCMKAGKVIGVE